MKKQYDSIDWAKTIGIFLICIAHFFPSGSSERIFVYSFHVPVFFFISGFLWSTQSKFNVQYVYRLSERLLIPYCAWFMLSVFPQIIMGEHRISFYLDKFFFLSGNTLWNSALWFIPCFFTTSILHKWLCEFANTQLSRHALLSVICFVIAITFDVLNIKECVFGINKSAFLLGIQFIGSAMRLISNSQVGGKRISGYFGLPLFVVTGMLSCIVNRGDNISIMNLDYNCLIVYILISISMSVSFVWFCTTLPKSFFIRVVSKNTIPIMCGHLFFRLILNYLMPTESLAYRTAGVWVFAIFVLAICLSVYLGKKSKRFYKFIQVFGFQMVNGNTDIANMRVW